MKKLFILLSIFCYQQLVAQNVGIGTTTPQATLDVKGNQRIGGLSNYIKYDSATGKIEWTNANLYVPVTQALMKHSAAADGLFYNNTAPVSGQLEYRNASGNPVFFTNFTNGRGYFGGDVGIGTTTPGAKLHVRYGASGYNGLAYFFGVAVEGDNNTYLNLLTPANRESGLLFGHPDNLAHGGVIYNNSFTGNGLHFRTGGNVTRMTITANGEVGIGTSGPAYKLHVNNGSIRAEGWNSNEATISMSSVGKFEVDAPFLQGGRFVIEENGNAGIGATNPQYKLDIAGRMRIRTGTASAGLWLNNSSNTEAAFIGMEDDTHVGLFGNNGAGWKLSMNTQTGALRVNGSEGSAGQILQTNGTGSPSSWVNPLNALYNNMTEYTQSGTLTVGPFVTSNIAGMSGISLVINSRSKVMFSSSINLKSNGCFGCGGSAADVIIQLLFPGGSAQNGGTATGNIATDETKTFVTANKIWTLDPGTYTVNAILRNGNLSGPTITGSFGRLDIIVIQE